MKIFKANRFANESADDLIESFKASGPALEQFFDKEFGLNISVIRISVNSNDNIEIIAHVDRKKSKSFVNSPLLSKTIGLINVEFGKGYVSKSQTAVLFDNPIISLSDFSNNWDIPVNTTIVFTNGKYSLFK